METLTAKSLLKYPVWKWDDIRENQEPVKYWDFSENTEANLFIKANFTAADGHTFDGYVIGLDTFYAFGIFINDEEYTFNMNLSDMFEDTMSCLIDNLGETLELFPLRYSIDSRFNPDKALEGVFTV